MVRRLHPHTTSQAVTELQTALDMQDAAEKLVATKLARLATLLSAADASRVAGNHRQKRGPVLVVSNPPASNGPISDNAA